MGDGDWSSDVGGSAWMDTLSFTNGPPNYDSANPGESMTDSGRYDHGNADPTAFNYGGPDWGH